MVNKSTISVELHSPTSSGAYQEQPDLGQLIQLKKLTLAVIDEEAIRTSQTVLLDIDDQCILSGTERTITNFSNEGGVKQRMVSSNKTKIRSEKTEDRIMDQ